MAHIFPARSISTCAAAHQFMFWRYDIGYVARGCLYIIKKMVRRTASRAAGKRLGAMGGMASAASTSPQRARRNDRRAVILRRARMGKSIEPACAISSLLAYPRLRNGHRLLLSSSSARLSRLMILKAAELALEEQNGNICCVIAASPSMAYALYAAPRRQAHEVLAADARLRTL